MRKTSSKIVHTTSFKTKVKFGISAFKDQKEVSLTVSKTDVFGRNYNNSPTVMEYGLDKVKENEEIELKIGSSSQNVEDRRDIKIPPRDNIRVVKILKTPITDSVNGRFINVDGIKKFRPS